MRARRAALPLALACGLGVSTARADGGALPLKEAFSSLAELGLLKEERPLSFRYTLPDATALAGVTFRVVCEDEIQAEVVTDESGVFGLVIRESYLERGCTLTRSDWPERVESELTFEGTASITSSEDGEALELASAEVLDLSQVPRIVSADGRLAVHYTDPAWESLARRTLERLVNADHEVTELFGSPLMPDSLVLHGTEAVSAALKCPLGSGWVTAVGPDGALDEDYAFGTFFHERAEASVRAWFAASRDEFDPRWIFDGLADLAALVALRAEAPAEANRLLEMRAHMVELDQTGRRDLWTWRSVRLQGDQELTQEALATWGYGPSLAAWLTLVEERPGGQRGLREFLDGVSARRTNRAACQVALEDAFHIRPRELRRLLRRKAKAHAATLRGRLWRAEAGGLE